MSGPLIPYVVAPEIPLSFAQHIPLIGQWVDPSHPPSIKPFGALVALGVTAGIMVSMARCRQRGLDTNEMKDFIVYVVGIGFVVSHVLDAVFYHPATVLAEPLYLLKIWAGLSSYGGFIGAVVGAFVYRRVRGHGLLEFGDILASAFPIAWIFGRTGCAVVHDHPGALSNAWYAVQYPAHQLYVGYDGRIDLGLVEMVLTIPLALAVTWLWRRNPKRASGFFMGFTLTAYAPVRFFLDYLRVQPGDNIFPGATDPRYLGLTPAQWACFAALTAGVILLRRSVGKPYLRLAPAAPAHHDDLDDES